ncbi:MAG: sulfatase-like hydrolase/transferase [Planctomycetales bacterium]|nr:sulfatase-like hydrolase/transferase [Planctomycetales bacterium]
MKGRHAICIVLDGLRASALGAYGNTSYPTPRLDSLASRSLVVDWLWADSPGLQSFYRSIWQGVHALRKHGGTRLTDLLRQAGVVQWMVTDDQWLAEEASRMPFDEALLVETSADQPASAIEETVLAQFFAHALEQVAIWQEEAAQRKSGSLLWIHARGLFGPWDAPRAMRAELLEEGDPAPAEYVSAPCELRQVEDPDEQLAHRVAYAAQVGVADACVGAFLQSLEHALKGSETLLMLLGSRGYALGEHGAIGGNCQELFGERLHLPWLMHTLGNSMPVARSTDLAQPADVGATLIDWMRLECPAEPHDGLSLVPRLRGESTERRNLAVSAGPKGELAARTPAWLMRCPQSPASAQLFAKPDDRWEFNDVASRCSGEVEQLQRSLATFLEVSQTGRPLPRE